MAYSLGQIACDPDCNCERCCNTCVEPDDGTTTTYVAITAEFVGTTGSFTDTPLSIGGAIAPEMPSTISVPSDIDGIEFVVGTMQCSNLDMRCAVGYIKDAIGDDEVSFSELSMDDKNMCMAGTAATVVNYANGGSVFTIVMQAFTFTTNGGARWLGVQVRKVDCDDAFPDRPDLTKCDEILLVGLKKMSDSGRITCDGVEEELELFPAADTYTGDELGTYTCNTVGSTFHEVVTMGSVIIRMSNVP